MLTPPKPHFPLPFTADPATADDKNNNTFFYAPCEEHIITVKFMQHVCRRLRFPIRTLSTACLYYHTFWAKRAGDSTNPSDIALTAILLASKTQETYKRIREILQAALIESEPEFAGQAVEIREETRAAVVKLEESLLECIDYKFGERMCLFRQLVVIGSVQLRNGRETMRRAWEVMVMLHGHPIVLACPGAYLVLACIMHTRASMNKDTHKELKYIESMRMNRRIVDRLVSHISAALAKAEASKLDNNNKQQPDRMPRSHA
jgi:CTD kinase subunit beta